MNITYRVQPSLDAAVTLRDDLGRITKFGESFAFALFLEGAARQRTMGVTVTVIGKNGNVLVGTVGELAESGE